MKRIFGVVDTVDLLIIIIIIMTVAALVVPRIRGSRKYITSAPASQTTGAARQ